MHALRGHCAGQRAFHAGRHARTRLVACSASVSTATPLDAILAYARSKSIATDKLTTTIGLASGQPLLVAAKDISAGEVIFSVPESTWLSPNAVQQSSIGKSVDGFEPWLQLSLFLLAEKANPTGTWKGYMDTLPAVLDSPLFWSEDELAMVRGTQLLENVSAYK